MSGNNDWCPNGCQDLCGLGECGMCGYVGDGVDYWDTDYVIDLNEETGRYERVPNLERLSDEFDALLESMKDTKDEPEVAREAAPISISRLAQSFAAGLIAGLLGA